MATQRGTEGWPDQFVAPVVFVGALYLLVLGAVAAAYPAAFDLRGTIFAGGFAILFIGIAALYLLWTRFQGVTSDEGLEVRVAALEGRGSNGGTRREVVAEEAVATDPFGDVHPVIEVEGVGPSYAKKLKTLGIEDTRELWYADAAEVAAELGIGSPLVVQWQQMCELIAVNGIGRQYAELLVKSGVRSIAELAKQRPAALVKKIEDATEDLQNRIQANPVTVALVTRWINAAKAHHPFEVTRRGATVPTG